MKRYNGFVERLAKKVQGRFDEIEAIYNMEYGAEFEIAVAEILREFLPPRFGVCRGFVVPEVGAPAGDDIIIYDRDYPTMRMLGTSLAQKEQVPFEAVYAYLEAKHTLFLEGGPDEQGSFARALSQIRKVDALPPRQRTTVGQIDRYTGFVGAVPELERPGRRSDFWNPMYFGIVARNCFISAKNKRPPNVYEAADLLEPHTKAGAFPSLVSAGNLFITPVHGPNRLAIPFAALDMGPIVGMDYKDLGEGTFGLGMLQLLWAIDQVKLGPINWSPAIVETANAKQRR